LQRQSWKFWIPTYKVSQMFEFCLSKETNVKYSFTQTTLRLSSYTLKYMLHLWTCNLWNIALTIKYLCPLKSVIYSSPDTASSLSLTWSINMKRETDSCNICGHSNNTVLISRQFILI
jgi:hypothetical protein